MAQWKLLSITRLSHSSNNIVYHSLIEVACFSCGIVRSIHRSKLYLDITCECEQSLLHYRSRYYKSFFATVLRRCSHNERSHIIDPHPSDQLPIDPSFDRLSPPLHYINEP